MFFIKDNSIYMKRAAELAKLGEGFVNPNPMVGAVIVKNGKIIGEGFHEYYGGLHAERNALKNCTESPCGADMYVTLEPCCHTGKQPPCTEAVIESGIKRVFVGSYDPNPKVSGKGMKQLRSADIEVIENFERELCDSLNTVFFKYITTGMPYVIIKAAVTADGKVAASSGDSKWITNEESRRNVHQTRKKAAAILTGIGTVLADDPLMNCRIENPKNPIRIVCDSSLRIPLDCKLVKTANEIPLIIATLSDNSEKIKKLEGLGVKIIKAEENNRRISLKALMKTLGEMKIDSVLIEAGSGINSSAIESGIADCIQIYIAPKLIGGSVSAFNGLNIQKMSDAVKLSSPKIKTFGSDVMLEYDVIKED